MYLYCDRVSPASLSPSFHLFLSPSSLVSPPWRSLQADCLLHASHTSLYAVLNILTLYTHIHTLAKAHGSAILHTVHRVHTHTHTNLPSLVLLHFPCLILSFTDSLSVSCSFMAQEASVEDIANYCSKSTLKERDQTCQMHYE